MKRIFTLLLNLSLLTGLQAQMDNNKLFRNTHDDNDDSDTAVIYLDKNIDSADIVYWIGSGERHVILAVNWADTCLAWGLRFDEESLTARQLMDAVAAADWRFSYTAGGFVNGHHAKDSHSLTHNPAVAA